MCDPASVCSSPLTSIGRNRPRAGQAAAGKETDRGTKPRRQSDGRERVRQCGYRAGVKPIVRFSSLNSQSSGPVVVVRT